jgi:AraC-like DNA-binding protein
VGRARTLLSETALSVKEIAFRSGFESEQYFCRLFRRKTGVSPGEWPAWADRHPERRAERRRPAPSGARDD